MIKVFEKENVKFIEIDNGFLHIVFSTLGASIYSIYFDNKIMTLTPSNLTDFKMPKLYHGKTIGRVANRLDRGIFKINEDIYQATINETPNTLHGGIDSLSKAIYNYDLIDGNTIVFKYLSRDGESGFPGNMEVKVKYTLKNNVLRIDFSARSDKDTMCNLTNHSYFCLGEESLENLELKINAHNYIEPRATDLIPQCVKKIATSLDFLNFKHILKNIDDSYLQNSRTKGYDFHFCFDEVNPKINQIILRSNAYLLEIKTDFNGAQIYSDNYEDDIEFLNSKLKLHRGVAIEPEDSHFDSRILKKEEMYNRFIEYKFSKV